MTPHPGTPRPAYDLDGIAALSPRTAQMLSRRITNSPASPQALQFLAGLEGVLRDDVLRTALIDVLLFLLAGDIGTIAADQLRLLAERRPHARHP